MLLPGLIQPEELRGVAVVIDQLRASTTICAAIHAGASAVFPFATIDEARGYARNFESCGPYLFGGEREGVRIPGFDLGNSPRAYRADVVAGKRILFTTTNGTQAVRVCELAMRRPSVIIGCLGNLSALVESLAASMGQPVSLICAGTHGRVSAEDVLAAGAIADRLCERGWVIDDHDDTTRIAMSIWRRASSEKGGIVRTVLDSLGGRNLCKIGLRSDVDFCAELDNVPTVPWLNGDGAFHGPDAL